MYVCIYIYIYIYVYTYIIYTYTQVHVYAYISTYTNMSSGPPPRLGAKLAVLPADALGGCDPLDEELDI